MARALAIAVLTLILAGHCCAQETLGEGEVGVEVVSIGAGNLARASDWAGVLVELRDQGTTQRDVIVEVETQDIDGDRPRYQRTVTTNPGAGAERVWVYAYLQPADQDRPLTVSVYEALPAEASSEELSGVRYEPGALLGRTTTAGRVLRPPELGTMLVVGRQPAGLAGYASRLAAGDRWVARGHEATDIASDLDPLSLPDRTVGYSGIETIVWTTADPTRLTPTRAEALRDWVRNGGHLVVSLPASPQVWLDTVRNPLAGLMPAVAIERTSGPVEPLRPLLTYDADAEIPDNLIVHRLRARADAGESDAWPILVDTEGRTIVARRRVGLGCVSVIGFDATNRTLASRGMPGMRPFWHRVLGRVGLPRDTENADRLTVVQAETRIFDTDISRLIAKGQAVVFGVLTGFGVFGLYWLIAAPVSYALLTKLSLKRHSWLAFVGCVAVFATVTWGGVTLLRPNSPEVQAVVFLDSAEGTTRTSVRGFATVLVPKYGEGGLRVGSGEDGETAAIAPWADPGSLGAAVVSGSFPDVRGYAVSGRQPDRMAFPARSTVKTVRADWSGERLWSTFRAVDTSGRPARLTLSPEGAIGGRLMHGLPAPLEDAIVLVVPPQERLAKRVGQADIARTQVRRIPNVWEAGGVVDLGAVFTPASDVDAAASRQRDADFFEDLALAGVSTSLGDVAMASRASRESDRLMAAALMSRMPPPRPGSSGERPIGLRRATHGLDLGEWFTQPSVIVLGIVRLTPESGLPFPLSIREGSSWQRLGGEGIVVVRWVYTLEPSPPDATQTADDLDPSS